MVEEEEEGGRRIGVRTGIKEMRRGKEKMRGVEKSLVQKPKGRYKSPVDQLEPVNQEKDPEKDPERGVTEGDSLPRPQLLPPPPAQRPSR